MDSRPRTSASRARMRSAVRRAASHLPALEVPACSALMQRSFSRRWASSIGRRGERETAQRAYLPAQGAANRKTPLAEGLLYINRGLDRQPTAQRDAYRFFGNLCLPAAPFAGARSSGPRRAGNEVAPARKGAPAPPSGQAWREGGQARRQRRPAATERCASGCDQPAAEHGDRLSVVEDGHQAGDGVCEGGHKPQSVQPGGGFQPRTQPVRQLRKQFKIGQQEPRSKPSTNREARTKQSAPYPQIQSTMIKSIGLENFKAFGKKTEVRLAPITLVYGQNSAGKSSVLNALNLLKQTRMSREQGALLLPRAERGLVDLGSFHELLYDHDSTRTLSLRVDLEISPAFKRSLQARQSIDLGTTDVGFEVGFRRDQNENDITLKFIHAYIGNATKPSVRFEPKELEVTQVESMRRYSYISVPYGRGDGRPDHNKLSGAVCTDVSEDLGFWDSEHSQHFRHKQEIVESLRFFKKEMSSATPASKQNIIFGGADISQSSLDKAINFYESKFSKSDYIKRRQAASKNSIVVLDGFMPVAANSHSSIEHPEWMAINFSRRTKSPSRLVPFFGAADLMLEIGSLLELALGRLFPLGPYRRAPQRLYIFTGTTPPDVGYSGNLLPDLLFRKRDLVKETNDWLHKLEIGYKISIESVGTPSNDLFEVRLLDTRRSSTISVALPDVGFGISQILPFVVQTLASQNQIITIEQPEVHIHPKLQADLADLLIAGIQPDREHRFIVETHSEHLALRLLKRIRQTTHGELPEGHPGLTPSQISVIYLDRGKEGTELHHLQVDKEGEFIDRWPHGFFEERAAELFE